MDTVQQFLNSFLCPPSGHSPEAIRARFQHWREVYSNPEKFTEDHSTHALAAKHKSARQCLRRLAERHPEIAASLLREREQQVEVQQ